MPGGAYIEDVASQAVVIKGSRFPSSNKGLRRRLSKTFLGKRSVLNAYDYLITFGGLRT